MTEDTAARLLGRLRPGVADLSEVINRLGAQVQDKTLPWDVSCTLVRHQQGPRITLNKDDTPQRQAYAMAHALGHYLQDPSSTRTCTRLALGGMSHGEIWANQFASAVLMPATKMRELHADGKSTKGMAQELRTGEEAVASRLRNLRLGAR